VNDKNYTDEFSEQELLRRKKLNALRESGVNPYPNNFKRNYQISDLLKNFIHLDSDHLNEKKTKISLAGRLVSRRLMGKASFINIRDGSGEIQVYVQKQQISEESYNAFKDYDLGDIIGVNGVMFRTRTGELSLRAEEIQLLVKSLHPLPDKYHGLNDIETKYRQRYVDLIANNETRKVFRTRALILNAFRKFLVEHDYLEIESPITLPIPGGANARPFVTHHNSLDMRLYLRVAQELAIKRCLVGGFDKVFELNRNFRNEGLSTQHNPEFTMLEYNEAYLDYCDYMDFTEKMIRYVVQDVHDTLEIQYQNFELNFEKDFERITLRDAVIQFNNDITDADTADVRTLKNICNRLGLRLTDTNQPAEGQLLIEIFDATVESKLIQPTFIIDYPIDVSPLARRSDSKSNVADRFELFIAGREIANGFSELNDSEDQAERFKKQAQSKETGDHEAMFYDEDYITALEYGMPPNAGGGIGIDRFVMLLTDQPSIRDVLLFPHLRPEK
tara:strand:+ start:2465 stop:3973 length:1509 start_codon:yes stop_codon:yes gene_type:complete